MLISICQPSFNNYFYFNSEWGSDCCLRPTQTFFSYNVARTSYFSMRSWRWGLFYTRPTILVRFV
jgi:hypothetical protein